MNIVPYLNAAGARPGAFRLPAAPDDAALLQFVREHGWRLYRLDLDGVRDKDALLARFARTLRFPDYFGGNWDALEDCLTDLEWDAAKGYALVLARMEELAGNDAVFATLTEVLDSAAAYWDAHGVPFWALAVDPRAVTPLPRLDAARR